MANACFGYQSLVPAATITTSTAVPGLTGAQLQNDNGSPSMAWQSTGVNEWLVIDSGNPASIWQAFGLFRTNLGTPATVRWRVGSAGIATGGSAQTSGFAGTTTFDSGVVSGTVAAGYGQSLVMAPGPVTGQVARVDISNNSNPDGFLNVPLCYAGPVWQMIGNIAWDAAFGRDDQVDELSSRGGQEYPNSLWVRRRWDVSMQSIRSNETWAQVMELDRTARLGGNVLFIFDPASADRPRETVYGRLKATSDLVYPFTSTQRRGWKARITERL